MPRTTGRAAIVFVVAAVAAVAQRSGERYSIYTFAGGAPTPTPVAADSAAVQPSGIAIDPSGSIYFGNSGWVASQAIFKLSADGMIVRIAGTGRRGFSGDGGTALNAQFSGPGPVAIDKNRNLYIADVSNGRIRRVAPDGIITTVAGISQFEGFGGDGGPAVEAALSGADGLATDNAGNLYIADSGNHRIREITTDGIIRTIAGNGLAGNSGDGGPATQASIGLNPQSIRAVKVDAGGIVWIAVDNVVRRISPDGIITTVAGNGAEGYSGDGGPALDAALDNPADIVVDNSGVLYIAVGSRIRRVSRGGIIETVVGNGTIGFSGDNSLATNAEISFPQGLALDPAGNLVIADTFNNRLRKLSPGGIISTIAGNGATSYPGDGGPATSAQLDGPAFVAADRSGNVFISDYMGQKVLKVSPDGTITTIAGVGGALVFHAVIEGEPAVDAQLGRVAGVVPDNDGNLFVADSDNSCVWKITANGLINRFAGNGNQIYAGDGGPAVQASFVTPWGLAIDQAGNLYIADENDNRVRRVSINGIISTVAGNGIYAFSGDAGRALDASLKSPQTVAVDKNGDIYIADNGNLRVRKVSANGTITTVVGDGTPGNGHSGGLASEAHTIPQSVALDEAGNLYILDGWQVRKVTGDQNIVTLAQSSSNNYAGDCGSAMAASFAGNGLVIGIDGSIYIADEYNGAVRILKSTSRERRTQANTGRAGVGAPPACNAQ